MHTSLKSREAKLDPKARKCVLLGYREQRKGYRLFDLNSAKVFHSRDVVFDEASMPGIQKEQGDSEENYVELKVDGEPITEEHTVPDSTGSEEANNETTNEEHNSGNLEIDQISPGVVPDTSDPPVRRSTRITST